MKRQLVILVVFVSLTAWASAQTPSDSDVSTQVEPAPALGADAEPARLDAPAETPSTGAAPIVRRDTIEAPDIDGDAEVQRGRYLVAAVAQCQQCHTPRDRRGALQMSKWLEGAAVPVETPNGYAQWAYKAPRISGLPQHTSEEFMTLMTTGVNRDGKVTMYPMPQFRLKPEDVQAIEAYLRALD
ncbi:MAG: c-type cytochrome [Acidobacteriota bacterium]